MKIEGKFYRVYIGAQYHDTTWGKSREDVKNFYARNLDMKELKKIKIFELR